MWRRYTLKFFSVDTTTVR